MLKPPVISETCSEGGAWWQVNGKLRGTVEAAKEITEADAVQLAYAAPGVARFVEGKDVKKIIFVPGRILNIIVGK